MRGKGEQPPRLELKEDEESRERDSGVVRRGGGGDGRGVVVARKSSEPVLKMRRASLGAGPMGSDACTPTPTPNTDCTVYVNPTNTERREVLL